MKERTNERTDQEWIRRLEQDNPQTVHDLRELPFTHAANLENHYRGLDDPANLVRDAAVWAYQRVRTHGVHQFRFECPFHALLQPRLDLLTPREREAIESLYTWGEPPGAVAGRLAISRNHANVIA